ncbi:MAG: hypothetical protein HY831_00650 [Candidatus Aenigmarchaeota archaeon]|nr:hypothetical protein [Candidatus Aenigmarchaeota archaeon]
MSVSTVLNWLDRTETLHWKYADSLAFDKIREAARSGTDEDKLYKMTDDLARDIRSNAERRENSKASAPHKMIHLLPHADGHGNISFYDHLTGHLVAGMHKMENGLFSYYGPADNDHLGALFGRGGILGMGGPYHQLADGNFFNYDSKRGYQTKLERGRYAGAA